MATTIRSSSSKRKSKMNQEEDAHHLSMLMMLGSQLLSGGTFNEGLPSFVTRGLDVEQIWQQLELRNEHKSSLTTCTRNAARIQSRQNKKKKGAKGKKVLEEKAEAAEEGQSDDSDEDGEDDSILNSIKKRLEENPADSEDDFGDMGDSDDDADLDFDFKVDNELTKGLSDDEDSDAPNRKKGVQAGSKTSKRKAPKRTTVVDDKFFKLADMEEFLDIEDGKEEKKAKQQTKGAGESDEDDEDDSEEEDEDIDMFGDMESDEDDAGIAKYADFFDPPYEESEDKKPKKKAEKQEEEAGEDSEADSEDILETSGLEKDDDMEDDDEMEEEDEELQEEADGEDLEEEADEDDGEENQESEEKIKKSKASAAKKKVSFTNDLLQSDEEEAAEDAGETDKEAKSSFELKQEQLQKRAREMEELSLKEATWELKGEASASKRPENSLLETVLDFQHTSRAAPVITDETTKTLEDYIKQRIKDKAFDDVERKEKPKEDAFEFKKRIVLDQEKSKLSLGELYEQEFLKQQQQDDEEVKEDPECEKIEKDLNKLFHQLDALSNFRFTPMKPGTEVKIIVNTPAIAMEEVAPVATADSELLAPEEVYEKKKGDVKANEERTSTDKKRALRQKKRDKRERKKAKEAREKVVQKMNPGLGNKYSKEKARKELEQLSKSDRNVTMIKGDRQKLGSSTAFFSQLQDEVQTNVKAKKVTKDAKKRKLDPSLIML
ncbi:U3 small nucleolar ribonucleoprotein protein MPP10 [Aplysia californica]|uniref:U3 small nucleolar ribonucleoprotein protein MPP10 n=1 Tax=Aplysia californica TaxID=6500 RepID=A0ABM0JFU9_APLCA|nr:U3 small nucleolar ribonucleoprotein protein MPP10 [Aplysia californica]